jgi:hypothetical protein
MRNPTITRKYEQNSFRLYDCPEPGCDMKGRKGLKSPQAVGRHRLTFHGIGKVTAATPGAETPTTTPEEGNGKHAQENAAQAAPASVYAQPNGIVQAAVKLMSMDEVRQLNYEQASQVFTAILSTKV